MKANLKTPTEIGRAGPRHSRRIRAAPFLPAMLAGAVLIGTLSGCPYAAMDGRWLMDATYTLTSGNTTYYDQWEFAFYVDAEVKWVVGDFEGWASYTRGLRTVYINDEFQFRDTEGKPQTVWRLDAELEKDGDRLSGPFTLVVESTSPDTTTFTGTMEGTRCGGSWDAGE